MAYWRIGVLVFISTVLMGCGELEEPRGEWKASHQSTDELRTAQQAVLTERPWDEEPPELFDDINGWTWVRQHKIEYAEDPASRDEESYNEDERDTRKINPSPNPFESSDYEYGYYYRPIADIGGWEYHLNSESLEKLGARMRSREIARLHGRTDIPNLYEGRDSDGYTPHNGALNESKSSNHLSRRKLSSDPTLDPSIMMKIIGTDDREPFNAWAGVFPLSAHGALYTTSGQSACTAFKAANHYSAATAAHCLYDRSTKTWRPRRKIQFKAGLIEWGVGDVPPPVPSSCYSSIISANYIAHPNLAKNDYAAIIFNGNGSSYCASNTYNFGYVGWRSVGVGANFESYLFGYPSGQPLPSGWPSLMTLSYSRMSGGIGQTIFQPNVVKHKHDTTGGQSGTALLSYSNTKGYQARAIHKGGATGNNNRGREFNGTVADWINSFVGQ